MTRKTAWLGGAAVGAGLMALLDPQGGRRRRALLKDKTSRAARVMEDAAGKTWRDLSHRANGLVAEARRAARGELAPDPVLAERVRSKLGRLVSHPSSIVVTSTRGVVRLEGPVLTQEIDRLIRGVKGVRGVSEVENRLELHDQPDGVPGLEGDKARRESRSELQKNWSPSARLIAGAAGALIALLGARRRGFGARGMVALGSGLFARAASNFPLQRLLRMASSRGVDIRKSVTVRAPVEQVFDLWSRWENFPKIFSHVREVRDVGNGRTQWKVVGPTGTELSFDSVVTAFIPNQLIAWKSAAGAALYQAGLVRFDHAPEGGTRVDLRMTYNPPAGALGQAVAGILGVDPKRSLDEDMVRLESLFSQGRTETRERESTGEIPVSETRGEAKAGEKRTPARPRRRRSVEEAPGPSREGLSADEGGNGKSEIHFKEDE